MYITNYFLGANGKDGFCSQYGQLLTESVDMRTYILKGSAGCGKSTAMKYIAAELASQGFDVAYVRCSGDPASIDAIIVPEAHLTIADGTAPHVLEPPYPGVCGHYVNLEKYCDTVSLRPERERIVQINAAYKKLYQEAYKLIKASQAVYEKPPLIKTEQAEAAQIARELILSVMHIGTGSTRKMFLSAFTCAGTIDLFPPVVQKIGQVYTVNDSCSSGECFMTAAQAVVQERQLEAIIILHPIENDRVIGIVFPKNDTAVFSESVLSARMLVKKKRVVLHGSEDENAMPDELAVVSRKLLNFAQAKLAEAKALHDELEKIYNPCVDFNKVMLEAKNILAAI